MSVTDMPAPAMGHNEPPLKERLPLDHEDMLAEAEKIAGEANDAPKDVAGEADLVALGKIVKAARELRKTADSHRETEKAPYLEACNDIQCFFAAIMDRMKRIQDALEARASAYQKRLAEEERKRREAEAEEARKREEHQRQIAAAEAERNRPTSAAKHQEKAEDLAREVAALAQPVEPEKVRTADVTVSSKGKWMPAIVDYEAMDLNELRHFFTRDDVEKALRAYVRVHKGSRPLAGVKIEQERKADFR